MKLTAIELLHRKIGRSAFGYKVSEVDDLLREVSRELEEAALDRQKMEEQMEILRAEITRYKQMEETLNNSILLAQRTADDLRASAHKEAEVLVREAEQRAQEISSRASRERQELMNEIRRLQERRDVFVDAVRSAARDLGDWLESRRWEEVIALPIDPSVSQDDTRIAEVTVKPLNQMDLAETADKAQEA